MSDLMIGSARALNADEAGGHGGRWRVVQEDVTGLIGEKVILPIYVAERLFEGDWRPTVGEYVSGVLWMQGYVTGKVSGLQ